MTNTLESEIEHFELHMILDSVGAWAKYSGAGLVEHLMHYGDGTLVTFSDKATGNAYAIKIEKIDPPTKAPTEAPAAVDTTESHADVPTIPSESPVAPA